MIEKTKFCWGSVRASTTDSEDFTGDTQSEEARVYRNSQTGISVVLRLKRALFALSPSLPPQSSNKASPKRFHVTFDPSNTPHPTPTYSAIFNLLILLRELRIPSVNTQLVISPGKRHPILVTLLPGCFLPWGDGISYSLKVWPAGLCHICQLNLSLSSSWICVRQRE